MNSAHHHHQLTSLIQAMFPAPDWQAKTKIKEEGRRGGLLITVCLTLEIISIKTESKFPSQDLSVCSPVSAADNKL